MPDTYAASVAIGDTIAGRCVTNYTEHTGRVVEVIAPVPYSGDYSPRFRVYMDDAPTGNRSRTLHLDRIVERGNPVPLTVTDADGNTWHAEAQEYGGRLGEWAACNAAPGDVRYRRQIRVSFPRYSRGPAIREAVAAAVLPHERLYILPMEHWGADDVTITTELIFPSSSWCVDCGHDVGPDRYGRVSPYAVYVSPAGSNRSYTMRNWPHQAAHEEAARRIADGDEASIGIDGCG